jgi:hypothetical protein
MTTTAASLLQSLLDFRFPVDPYLSAIGLERTLRVWPRELSRLGPLI